MWRTLTTPRPQPKCDLLPYSAFTGFRAGLQYSILDDDFADVRTVHWIFESDDEAQGPKGAVACGSRSTASGPPVSFLLAIIVFLCFCHSPKQFSTILRLVADTCWRISQAVTK